MYDADDLANRDYKEMREYNMMRKQLLYRQALNSYERKLSEPDKYAVESEE